MFFSNTSNIDNIKFSFNGKIIPLSTSHKHLGVILFQNAKWNEHLENMITNYNQTFRYITEIKIQSKQIQLEKNAFNLHSAPFEYACVVWDTNNCGIGYSDKLEKIIRRCQNCNRFTHFDKIGSIQMPKQVGKHYQSEDIAENSHYVLI